MINLHYGGRDIFFEENEILTPGLHYSRLCQIQSDINEHLPVLKRYAEECRTVTEMGVRFACSTWAFIEGKPKSLTCIDIMLDSFLPSEKYVKEMCDRYGIEFKWVTGDSLKIEIEETEMLFIDTLHTYTQLLGELKRHSEKVSKYIILHDTVSFAMHDEGLYDHASNLAKVYSEKKGILAAVVDFLEDKKNWKIKEHYVNNNGLMVLERI